jgi:hypothetical protein
MARYSSQQIKLRNGVRVFTTTRYPRIPHRLSDVFILTSEGDRLDIISFQFYGRSDYWWIVAIANNLGRGTLIVTGDQQIRVPIDIDEILQEFNRLNNVT